MKTKSQFVNTLLDNIRQRGAMDCLITDHAAEQMSQRVLDVLRHLLIDSWTSEPHQQRQNFAERRWHDVKRIATWLMGYKGVPPDCWLLCLEYVADVMNLTAIESLHTGVHPLSASLDRNLTPASSCCSLSTTKYTIPVTPRPNSRPNPRNLKAALLDSPSMLVMP